tara:strand:- start:9 stop:833 length:825 start_codon:yes stop_codon:yes gene_type:complete
MSLAQYLNNSEYGGGFGLKALERARAGGMSDNDIRSQLSSAGLVIGRGAGDALGADTSLYGYRGAGGQFGQASYQAASAAGLSDAQIRSSLAMSGLQIGDQAGKSLNVNAGKTYLGYSPNTQQSFGGNNGQQYGSRPMLAPRGYGMDGRFSSDQGYSPTLYVAGGANDYDALNSVFGTNYQGGPDIGGGYSDPDFHKSNYVAPANDPDRPFGGYPAGQGPSANVGAGKNVNVKSGSTTVKDRTSNSTMKIGTKKADTTTSGSSAFKRTNTSLTV